MADIDAGIMFIPCADLDRSTAFYRDLCGLPLVLDQGTCRIFRVARSAYLGVCRKEAAATTDGLIITLVTGAVDELFATLQAAGAPVVTPPESNDEFHIYHAFVRDPDGHLLEIQRFHDPAWAVDG